MSDSRSQIIFICHQPSAIRYRFTVGRRLEVKAASPAVCRVEISDRLARP